jgi:hypothetical protein
MLHFLFFFGLLFLIGALFRGVWSLAITPTNMRFVTTNASTGPVQTAWFLLQVYIVAGWVRFACN